MRDKMAIIAAGPGLKAAATVSLRIEAFLRTWELQLSAEALNQLCQQFLLFSPPKKRNCNHYHDFRKGKPKPPEGEGTFPSIISNDQEEEEAVLCLLITLKAAHKRFSPWYRSNSEGHYGIDCRTREFL